MIGVGNPPTVALKNKSVPQRPVVLIDDRFETETIGSVFTFTEAVIGVPTQPLAEGVTVYKTFCCEEVVFTGVPEIFPEPLVARPVTFEILFRDQLYVVPLSPPLKTIVEIADPEQTVWLEGVATAFGTGLISIVAVLCEMHPDGEVAVIVMVPVFTVPVLFVPVPLIVFPVPDDGEIEVLPGKFPVQLKVVPGILLLNEIVEMEVPEQMDCDDGDAVITGGEFTVNVTVEDEAVPQLFVASTE